MTEAPQSLFIQPQVVLENASVIQETNRRPDVYCFINKEGRVYSPNGQLVLDNIKRRTHVEKLEAQAGEQMEKISKKASTLLWISPPQFGVYDVGKIIITKVIEEKDYSVLLNRAVVLDSLSSDKALKLARYLSDSSINTPTLTSINDVRSNLIALRPEQDWLTPLKRLIPDPQWSLIETGEDIKLQEQALLNARSVYEAYQTGNKNGPKTEDFKGNYEESCPTGDGSAFQAFWGASKGKEGCKRIACQRCSWVAKDSDIRKIQAGHLTSCPECGWRP